MAEGETPRVRPLEPPYPEEIQRLLSRWMVSAPEREPLKLFRTLAVHPELASRMGVLSGLLLGHPLIDPREREIVIHRTTARSGAEYEWGVHAAIFGTPLGLSEHQLHATVHGAADDPAWSDREALLVALADELHETGEITDALWLQLERRWNHAELLELIVTAGWYRLISQVLRAIGIEAEPWAPRFPRSARAASNAHQPS